MNKSLKKKELKRKKMLLQMLRRKKRKKKKKREPLWKIICLQKRRLTLRKKPGRQKN